MDTVLFDDSFVSTSQNTAIWRSAVSTFTLALAAGYVIFNNSSVVTSGAAQVYQTWRTFSLEADAPLSLEIRALITIAPPSNWTANFGFSLVASFATPYTPTDGAYFRINSNGIYGVVNYAGTESVSGLLLAAASIPINANNGYRIIVTHNVTEFWFCGANNLWQKLGELPTPPGTGQPFASSAVPVTLQVTQPSTAGAAEQIKFSDVTVVQRDVATNKPWPHIQVGQGLSAYQGQNGNAMGSTALYSNSLASGAGVALTNTTAAAGSGLGGQFSFQPTLAVGTDGILSSYQNPAGTYLIPGRTLYITGVTIQSVVSTTALTGGPVVLAYSLAFGHTSVSLATAEAIAAKAPRRVALGVESFAAAAAVGVLGSPTGITRQFASPIVVNAGEFLAVVAKNVGVVTTGGVISALITFDGYYE
jgi:hypothetical protein